jgi:hypothetical protein
VIRVKKLFAVAVLVLGISGVAAATAPSASALPVHVRGGIDGDAGNDPICVRVHVDLFGTVISSGPEPICLT